MTQNYRKIIIKRIVISIFCVIIYITCTLCIFAYLQVSHECVNVKRTEKMTIKTSSRTYYVYNLCSISHSKINFSELTQQLKTFAFEIHLTCPKSILKVLSENSRAKGIKTPSTDRSTNRMNFV